MTQMFTTPMVAGGICRVRFIDVRKGIQIIMSRMSDAFPEWARNLVAVLCMGWVIYVGFMVYQLRQFSNKVVISQQDRVIEERVHLLFTKAENSERGFLITGKDEYEHDYYSSTDQLNANLRTLVVYLKPNPAQFATLDELSKLIHAKLDEMDANIKLYHSTGKIDITKMAATDTGLKVTRRVEDLINTLTAEERDHLRHLNFH